MNNESTFSTEGHWLNQTQAFFLGVQRLGKEKSGEEKVMKVLSLLKTLMGAEGLNLLNEENEQQAQVIFTLSGLPQVGYVEPKLYKAYTEGSQPQVLKDAAEIGPFSHVFGYRVETIVLLPLQSARFNGILLMAFTNPLTISNNFMLFLLCCQGQLREIVEAMTIHRTYTSRLMQFYGLIHKISQGFVFVRKDLSRAFVNQAAAHWLKLPSGYMPAELLAKAMNTLRMWATNRDEIPQITDEFLTNIDLTDKEWFWKYSLPRPFILKISSQTVDTKQLEGTLWLMDDVTSQYNLNDELAAANEELSATNEELTTLSDQLKEYNETILQLSEQALQVSEQKFLDLTENMDEMFMVVDKRLQFTYCNKAAESILHYSRTQINGRKVQETVSETISKQLEQAFEKVIRSNESAVLTAEYMLNGRIQYVEITAFPTPNSGAFCIIRNITARKLAEFQFLELAESITAPLIVLDENFRYLYWNKATEQATGKQAPDVIGKTPQEALGEQYYQKYKDRFDTYKHVMQTGVAETVTNVLFYNNRNRHVEIAVYPTKRGGVLALTNDITQRYEAEQQEIRLNQELVRQNQQLQQFGYITSHNIRGPVATLLGLIQLFDETNYGAPINKITIDHINTTVTKLDTVIRDLNIILDYKQNINYNKEIILLETLYEDVRTILSSLIEESGSRIETDFSQATEVLSVRSYLHSIFYNLVSNAIKFRDLQRPLVLKIQSHVSGNEIILSFADNGLGMDLHEQGEKIFGLYKRFHPHIEGRGLGLHLVKIQLESLHGQIHVQSTPGRGTTFIIHLPKTAESI